MTYDEKRELLTSYRRLKGQLRLTKLELAELRDLKRISDDVGLPPTKGNVSDPTGNAAMRVLSMIYDTEQEMMEVLDGLERVRCFIRNAEGIDDEERSILTMKFINGYSSKKLQQVTDAQSKEAVRKQVYRIVGKMKAGE